MDVDVGGIWENSGTAWQNSGTRYSMSEEAMSVDLMEVDDPIFPVRPVPGWAQPIMAYMMDGSLPSNEVEARQVQRRSKAYIIINLELYKRSVNEVLQRCVEMQEGQEMLLEIHQGECGHHDSSRALVAKVFRHGFYWPRALNQQKISSESVRDVRGLLKRSTCQPRHSRQFQSLGPLQFGVWIWWESSGQPEVT